MVDTSRRFFLGGILSVGVASIIAPTASLALPPPMIMSDGIHDDWAGLTAAIRGEPFSFSNNVTVTRCEDGVIINGGNFFFSRALRLKGNSVSISNSSFTTNKNFKGDCLFEFIEMDKIVFDNVHLNDTRSLKSYV